MVTCAPVPDPFASASQIVSRSVLGWMDLCSSSAAFGAKYWQDAVVRGATPYDLAVDGLRWLQIVGERRAPSWSTPNEILSSSEIMTLRDFSVAGAGGVWGWWRQMSIRLIRGIQSTETSIHLKRYRV